MSGADTDMTRLHELLADRATEGLAPEEGDELSRLLRAVPADDDDSLEWAAAAVDLPIIAKEMAPMPASLRAKVERDAVAWLARSKGLTVVDAGGAQLGTQPGSQAGASPAPTATAPAPAPSPGLAGWLPWLIAAACIVITVAAWWPGAASPAEPRDLLADRQALLDRDGTRRIAWNDPLETGVTGDVVWNDETQSGYMRFVGLAANDPRVMQYQLWIFDAAREAYSDITAVDGGVFDATAKTGEIIVPIRAKLRISQPSLFAVTTEPPGGVIKHNPERDPEKYKIILTAGV